MPKRTLESLGALVREKRGKRKLRETAAEIGISPPTLMRVEGGRIPDVETFGKLCRWLQVDPGSFLGFEAKHQHEARPEPPLMFMSAHYKTDHNPQQETVQALARMMVLAMRMQPEGPLEQR